MSSTKDIRQAHVWVWLPGSTEPVVAGRMYMHKMGGNMFFRYAESYLASPDALPLYMPELPLRAEEIKPMSRLIIAGCLRDAAPDAWGRCVIERRWFRDPGRRVGVLDEIAYLLESGSDRIGALDFQQSGTKYVPREGQGMSLEQFQVGAEKIEADEPLPPELDGMFWHGSSIGGARPKALLDDGGRKLIAKFSSSLDRYPVIRLEFVAMRLAERVGLSVAPVEIREVAGKSILLVERFDRQRGEDGWRRRMMVSALTLFGLPETGVWDASYEDLAEIIRHRFTAPRDTLRELFGRLVFNVICGNTDDHARNHAAFWDGARLTLTPAYDICPQLRTGNIAAQAMAIIGRDRRSTLETCRKAAHLFMLGKKDADAIIEHQLACVRDGWEEVCDEAGLSRTERGAAWERSFLNPYIFEGKDDL